MTANMQRIAVPFEIKSLDDSGSLEGYGAVFGNIDAYGDVIIHGAFSESLREHAKKGTLPVMLWMHSPDRIPGVWEEMREDEKGLYVKGRLVATELGAEVRTLLKAKALSGLSIGFSSDVVDFNKDGNRLLRQVKLWEVSIVSLPANDQARVTTVKAHNERG